MSDEKRDLFEYGSKNEINGLATLVGKYLPVFLPHNLFCEIGCRTINLANDKGIDSYAVSSGDGTDVQTDETPHVVFEIKCPRPGKVHTTDVYYKLPVYYSIQVMAEMETGGCDQFVNICYNPESTTFISGKKCDQWNSVIKLTKKILV